MIFAAMVASMPLAAIASTTWTLQGTTYDVDTLYHATVGPGTTQTSLALSGGSDLKVFYSTIDLTNPYIDVQTVHAGDKVVGTNTLTGMVNKYQTKDSRYVTGVNADFFGSSAPVSTSVVNGEYYAAFNSGWDFWGITKDTNQPIVATMTFSGTVSDVAGNKHELSAINRGRGENQLILYTKRMGANTGTNSYGIEASAKILSGELAPGKSVEIEITSAPATAGSMAIPADGFVLSGHGTAKAFIEGLSIGDKLTVSTSLTTAEGEQFDAFNLAGGRPLILGAGQVLETQGALDHLVSLNPRTAIGYDKDRTKLVILVVDGRSTASKGVVSKVLADMMLNVGCYDAMNFDGGGSSAIYVNNLGIRNEPSDGKERGVVNAVFAVSNTPEDNVVAKIEFEDWAVTLPKYGIYKPVINAFNKYGVWIGNVNDEYTLTCDAALGEIQSGNTLLTSGAGTHALTAHYGDLTATLPVTVGVAAPEFRLDSVLVDGFYDYSIEVQSLVGDKMLPVANQALTWSSDDVSIATVDELGLVHGIANGTTKIRGAVGEHSAEITVNVEIPQSHVQVADMLNNLDEWTVSKTNVKDVVTTVVSEGGMNVDFTVSSTRNPSLTLVKDLYVWSRPDSLVLTINPGNGAFSALNLTYSLAGSRNAMIKCPLTLTPNVTNDVKIDLGASIDKTAPESYPFIIKRLQFAVEGASGTAHSTYVGPIKAIYNNVSPDAGVESVIADSKDGIDFSKTVEYFNLQGVKVAKPSKGELYIIRQGANAAKVLY